MIRMFEPIMEVLEFLEIDDDCKTPIAVVMSAGVAPCVKGQHAGALDLGERFPDIGKVEAYLCHLSLSVELELDCDNESKHVLHSLPYGYLILGIEKRGCAPRSRIFLRFEYNLVVVRLKWAIPLRNTPLAVRAANEFVEIPTDGSNVGA